MDTNEPIVPMDTTKRPVPPIVPFAYWTWQTPVIPQFYWNVYSAEQRIKQICAAIGKIEDYLDYFVTLANDAHAEIEQRIDDINTDFNNALNNLENALNTAKAELQAAIDAERDARIEGDTALNNAIEAETAARISADNTLREAINTLEAALNAEEAARQDADNALHDEISAETTARIHADDALHDEISEETTDRIHADDELRDAIAAETEARLDGDTELHGEISAEMQERTVADAELRSDIDTNANNINVNADNIAKETAERKAADTALQNDINTRLTPGDIVGANRITVTNGPNNKVTIGDTFDADFDAIENDIAGIQSALNAETSERRHDDAQLQTQINNRIELGKVLATAPITVTNDPDQTTATVGISAATDNDPGAVSIKTVRDQSLAGSGLKDAITGNVRYVAVNPEPGKGISASANGVGVQINPNGGLYHTGDGIAINQAAQASATASRIAGKGLIVSDNKLNVNVGAGLEITSDGKVAATGGGGTGTEYKAGAGIDIYTGVIGVPDDTFIGVNINGYSSGWDTISGLQYVGSNKSSLALALNIGKYDIPENTITISQKPAETPGIYGWDTASVYAEYIVTIIYAPTSLDPSNPDHYTGNYMAYSNSNVAFVIGGEVFHRNRALETDEYSSHIVAQGVVRITNPETSSDGQAAARNKIQTMLEQSWIPHLIYIF